MCGIHVCADARVERTRGRCVLPDTCLTLFNLVNVFQFISGKLALACASQLKVLFQGCLFHHDSLAWCHPRCHQYHWMYHTEEEEVEYNQKTGESCQSS